MIAAQPTPDEVHRIGVLWNYGVLDTPREQALDDLTALAAQICGAPIAAISLIDEHRQWFKATVGWEIVETPRDISFCGHAVHQRDLFIVPDASQDERFRDNPLVTGQPGIRFYAGAPLVSPEGLSLGALCVMDHVPRRLTQGQRQALRVLARQVMTHLELRRHMRELVESEGRLRIVTENARVGLVILDRDRRYVYENNAHAEILNLPPSSIVGQRVSDVLPEVYEEQIRPRLDRAFAGERVVYELRRPAGGGDRHYAISLQPTEVNGEVTLVVAVVLDITEPKLAEIACQQLAAIVEFSDDAIISKDVEGIVTSWNKGAEKVFGYTAGEMVGHSILRLIPADRQDEENEILAKIKRGENLEPCETLGQTKEGRVINVSVTASPIKDATGKVIGASKVVRDITERRRAQKELQEERDFILAVVDTVGSLVVVLDREARIVRFNRACEHLTGYSFDEVKGRSAIDLLLAPEETKATKAVFENMCAGHFPCAYENDWMTKDGGRRLIAWSNTALVDTQGVVEYVIGTGTDITERKRAEEERQRVGRRMQVLLESAGEGIYGIDVEGRCTFINRAGAELLGYGPDEMLGRNMHDLAHHHREDGSAFPVEECPIFHAFKEGGQCRVDTEVFWHKDGSSFPVEYSSYPILEQGEITGAVITFTDTTERKQAAEKIAEQAALLDKARDAILVRDLEGKILFWNSGAERMYGWPRLGVVGEQIGGLLYADARKFEEVNALTISHGEWYGELQQLTKDRGEIIVEARWTLIRDHEGRPKSILAINTDITEKKKLEAQFLRTQRMESVGTLAGGIAHDLNNVFGPILMITGLLEHQVTDAESQKLLHLMEASAQHGADLVRQVLAFARGVEGNRMLLNPVSILNEIQDMIRDTFPKKIESNYDPRRGVWPVTGDPTQLRQVFTNLCVNARDAMPNGGTLMVTVENVVLDDMYADMNPESKPGDYVMVTVADTGSGIPAHIRDKIFEPFFTTKEIGKGTGLGLSTTVGILRSHGGFIRVYSEIGKGSTFEVYLPANGASKGAEAVAVGETVLPRGHGELVLVVDDEERMRAVVQSTLEQFGYRVLLAANGAEAVALYAQNRDQIEVVLTDMAMPVMDGPATIVALISMNPNLKIIGSSGLPSDGDFARAAGGGCKYFISKPYTAETILDILAKALRE